MIRLKVSGVIEVLEADEITRQSIMSALQIKNPTYYQAIRANPRAKYAISEYIKYYELRRDGQLVLPRGVLKRIEDYARRAGQELIIEDERCEARATGIARGSTFKPRDYQLGIVESALEHDSGVLQLDTGFGKTLIGLELAHRRKQKTLIIVPKLDLLENWRRECEKILGFNPTVLQGSRTFNEGNPVTLTTIQTLVRRVKGGALDSKSFGTIIVDECHGFVSKIAQRTIGSFPAKYRYGLTATARRTDGQGEAINFLFGPTVLTKKMDRETPTVHIVRHTGHIWVQEYAQMIDELIASKGRNKQILDILHEEVGKGRKVLVLTKRVEHYETLKAQYIGSKGTNVFVLSSKEKKEVRAAMLAGMRDNTLPFSVLLGTFSLLGTGIDIPSLDTLVIAGDLKSDVLTEQSAGRILRLFEGKQEPKVIDIWDTNNPILKKQGLLRQDFYRSQNWYAQYENATKTSD